MADGGLIVITLTILILIMLGLAVLSVFVMRMHRDLASPQGPLVGESSGEQHLVAEVEQPLIGASLQLQGALTHLSFTESLDPDRFAIASQACVMSEINEAIESRSADGIVFTVKSLRLISSEVEMTVTASSRGQVLLAEGNAILARHKTSGRVLPILKDPNTGKIIENMKGMSVSKALARLGDLSAAIVGAAHIVAGADIAKRLKQVDSKVELLLAYRHADQMAKLERIYTSAKELGIGQISQEKCRELWRLRGELREMRCAWRLELRRHLDLIEDPADASFFKKLFTRTKTGDRQTHGQITEGQSQIAMIEYSMRLDLVLAAESRTLSAFKSSLADELVELDAVSVMLKSKAALISGRYPELSVDSTTDGMDAIVGQYRQLLSDHAHVLELPVLTRDTVNHADGGAAV